MASAVVAVRSALAAYFGSRARVVTQTPATLEDVLPLIRVVGAGGPQVLNMAGERIVIETFHATESDSITLAVEVNDYLAYQLRGVVAGAVISKITVESVPSTNYAYANPAVSQQTARYRVSHRPSYN